MAFKIILGFIEVFAILLIQHITLGSETVATNKTSLITQNFATNKTSPITQNSVNNKTSSITQNFATNKTSPITQNSVTNKTSSITQNFATNKTSPITQNSVINKTSSIMQNFVTNKTSPITQNSVTNKTSVITQKFATNKTLPITQNFATNKTSSITQNFATNKTSPITQNSVTNKTSSITQNLATNKTSTVTQNSVTNKTSITHLSTIVQNTLTDSILNTTVIPIDVQSISAQMINGFRKVQSISSKLLQLTVLPTLNSENLYKLLATVHNVFDTIIATTRGLEHKLNGIVGVIDLPITNIQIALQALIQAIVVNVVIVSKTTDTAWNTINYSLLGIVDGIQWLVDRVHNLLHGIVTLPRNDLAKSITCLEGIVQTVLSIVENVLNVLNEFLSNFEMNSKKNTVMPELTVALTKSLNTLAAQRNDPVTIIVKESLAPTLVHIISTLKANVTSVNESTLNLIKNIIQPVSDLASTITGSQKSEAKRSLLTIPYITRTISASILSVCDEVQTLKGTIGVQSTFYVELSNVIASLHSLTDYLIVIMGYDGFTSTVHNTTKLLTDTQTVLLLLATNIETLIDTATQVISQSLIYALRSTRIEIKNALKDVQESSLKIALLLENVVKVNLHSMQTLLYVVSRVIHNTFGEYSKFLATLAMSIVHTVGDLSNVIGEVLPELLIASFSPTDLNGQLPDVAKTFKIIVNNVENLRIYVRNTLKEIELVL